MAMSSSPNPWSSSSNAGAVSLTLHGAGARGGSTTGGGTAGGAMVQRQIEGTTVSHTFLELCNEKTYVQQVRSVLVHPPVYHR
jgi:hypothetical protein